MIEYERLEPDDATMHEWSCLVCESIVRHIATLPEQPAGYDELDLEAALENADLVRAAPGPEGRPLDELLRFIFGSGVRTAFNTAGPGYLAYIPGGGLFASALADFVASAVNRYVGVWAAAPLFVEIESRVIRWMCSLFGWGAESAGLLTSGGSIANLVAIVTAREERLGQDIRRGAILVSDQCHHSVVKAARIAGLRESQVVEIETDASFAMRPCALEREMKAVRANGDIPFLVVASGGTTNTGAIDPLAEIAELCREHSAWLHVDAAYGGFFALTERGKKALAGIERADSMTLDPHKGMFLPYGTGAVIVRDGESLRRAHTARADYMPPMQGDPARWDFCEMGPELSRSFRGLGVWLPLMLHGVSAFESALNEKLDLARRAERRLAEIPGVEIATPAALSIVTFRLVREGSTPEETDALNRRLLARILARQRVWLTATTLHGRFVIRICVLSFRTHADRLDECLEIIANAILEV